MALSFAPKAPLQKLAILTQLLLLFLQILLLQEYSLPHPQIGGVISGKLLYKGVDVMKWTKDRMRNQPTDAEIDGIVRAIMSAIKPTHISIAIPLDDSQDYPFQNKPSPRGAAAFTQKWSEVVHGAGAKVLWRGTWSGIEGIYDFPKRLGANRFPAGSAASAPSDGEKTWLGKTYQYIVAHPTFFADGDIWAPLPERTEGIFNDATSFLPATGAGLQTNYANFFNDLKTVSDAAFAKIGKQVTTGLTAQNFSEINSGWMPQSVLQTAGFTVVDHYGLTHTPQEMEFDLRKIYIDRGKQIFLQEWGDYWHPNLPEPERKSYLSSMYAVFQKLVTEGILIGFNYWGAWDGNREGILLNNGSGDFQINDRGLILASFFVSSSQLTDNVAPTISLTAPANNAVVSLGSLVTVSANAADNIAVAGVQFKLGGANLEEEDTIAPYSVAWNTTAVSLGTHVLTAMARDTAGNVTTSAGVTVTVNSITAPVVVAPPPSAAPQVNSCEEEGHEEFYACYYDNKDFTNLRLTRIDKDINFPWGEKAPHPQIDAETFSVKWAGTFLFESGTYEFSATADDGVRLYIDNVLVLDKWIDQRPTIYKITKSFASGLHLIKMEYYENIVGATAELSWKKLAPPSAREEPKEKDSGSTATSTPPAVPRSAKVVTPTSTPKESKSSSRPISPDPVEPIQLAPSPAPPLPAPSFPPSPSSAREESNPGQGSGGGSSITPPPPPVSSYSPPSPEPAKINLPDKERALTSPKSSPPPVVLPYNSREGEVIKFPHNSTVYLVKKTGLHPFQNPESFESYTKTSGWDLRVLPGDSRPYTIQSAPASSVVEASKVSYVSGTLVNDQGTIYLIRAGRKIPFATMEAFTGLGYSLQNVILGDLSTYSLVAYQMNVSHQTHAWGSWVLFSGTVYYTHPSGLIGVSDYQTFLSNNGQDKFIVPANAADLQILQNNPHLPVLTLDDPRVFR